MAQFDRNHWHPQTETGGTNQTGIATDRLKFEKESFKKKHNLDQQKFTFDKKRLDKKDSVEKKSLSIRDLTLIIGAIATLITIIITVTQYFSEESDRANKIDLSKLAYQQQIKNEFRKFVWENEDLLLGKTDELNKDKVAQIKALMKTTFPQDVVDVDSFSYNSKHRFPKQKDRSSLRSIWTATPFLTKEFIAVKENTCKTQQSGTGK